MTQEELKRLEANLTKSALKAQKYYVRGIVGYTPEEQGFLPISIIPVYNPIQGKETMLIQFIEDVGVLKCEYDKTKQYLEDLETKLMLINEVMAIKIAELERIQAATDSLVLE